MLTLFWILLIILAAQRLCELIVSSRNEAKLVKLGGSEIDRNGYRFIVGMHLLFFVSLATEETLTQRTLYPEWPLLLTLIAAAQALRIWSMFSLGTYWSARIFVVPNQVIITKGVYRFFRHPAYLAVIIEIAAIPLMFSCYLTAFLFTIVNAFTVSRRMEIEWRALGGQE